MIRLVLTLCLLAPFSLLHAALDPELTKPYVLRIVLHFGEHRLLTDSFKDQVERDVRDGMEASLGDLARVEVVRDHPSLKDIAKRGLRQALANYDPLTADPRADRLEISDHKTHFVLIDFVEGQYIIRSRQIDGRTGLATPVARREQTADRELVGRKAALLIDRDFGLVGTVTEKADSNTVRVAFQASGLGVPLLTRLKKGAIFSLVQVRSEGSKQVAARVPWALLQTMEEPRDGSCLCRLFHRHANPLGEEGSVLGCRCLQISTASSALRIRFIQATDRALEPQSNLQIVVRRRGFDGEDNAKVQGVTNADGFFQSQQPFDHVAFVSVLSGGAVRANIPVALVDGRTVVCRIDVTADSASPLVLRRNYWVRRAYDKLQVLSDLFQELNDLTGKADARAGAREKAQKALDQLGQDMESLAREREGLEDAAKQSIPPTKLDLTPGDQGLQELRKSEDQLRRFIGNLENILNQENDPKRKELLALFEQGTLQEDNADFAKAIETYDKVLSGGLDDPKLKQHLAKLKNDWKIKDEKHRLARKFIYETWPKLEMNHMEARIKEAREAFETCKQAGDQLTPRKLLKIAVSHVAKLGEKHAALQPDINEEDHKTAKLIATIAEGLKTLMADVAKYLKSTATANK